MTTRYDSFEGSRAGAFVRSLQGARNTTRTRIIDDPVNIGTFAVVCQIAELDRERPNVAIVLFDANTLLPHSLWKLPAEAFLGSGLNLNFRTRIAGGGLGSIIVGTSGDHGIMAFVPESEGQFKSINTFHFGGNLSSLLPDPTPLFKLTNARLEDSDATVLSLGHGDAGAFVINVFRSWTVYEESTGFRVRQIGIFYSMLGFWPLDQAPIWLKSWILVDPALPTQVIEGNTWRIELPLNMPFHVIDIVRNDLRCATGEVTAMPDYGIFRTKDQQSGDVVIAELVATEGVSGSLSGFDDLEHGFSVWTGSRQVGAILARGTLNTSCVTIDGRRECVMHPVKELAFIEPISFRDRIRNQTFTIRALAGGVIAFD